jgi:hypothetical protein
METDEGTFTSHIDPIYNCIAWAAGDNKNKWWPMNFPNGYYWPRQDVTQINEAAFIAAFSDLGYEVCADESFEPGYEKIAIYVDINDTPTHAARQTEDGAWTSKIGGAEDIRHKSPSCLEGKIYGRVSVYMRRPHQPGQ